jgi:tripartite ATP-independent transporter DctM subunit
VSVALASLITGITLLGALVLEAPVAIALCGTAILLLWLMGPLQFDMLGHSVFGSLHSIEILSLPLFILMGEVFSHSKISSRLFEALDRWLRFIPGHLSIATIFSTALFAALSGSSTATAAAVGAMAIPEMRNRGYPAGFAAATVVAGGTLGILIPPSVTLILYGVAADVSIGQLFMAGVIPGLLIAALFALWAVIYPATIGKTRFMAASQVGPAEGIAKISNFKLIWYVIPPIGLVVGILALLYGGVASPSEVGAFAATFAVIMAWAFRDLSFPRMGKALERTAHDASMVMLIVVGAALLVYPLSFLRIPQTAAEMVASSGFSAWGVIGLLNLLILVMGMFLPPVAIVVIITPIVLPLVQTLGFDPVWFGILITLNMEIGMITPPVGGNLFVVQGIAPDISIETILVQVVGFVGMLVIGMILLCVFPDIVLWLPSQMR